MVVRRLVTGNGPDGKSRAEIDGPSPGSIDVGRGVFDELWRTFEFPPSITGNDDPADVDIAVLNPGLNGIAWRCVTFRPWSEVEALLVSGSEGIPTEDRFDDGGAMEKGNPGWHTTDTLDFGLVVSGQIDLELDDGIHHLVAGDAVVQRATRQAWKNRSNKPSVMSFVLISREQG